MKNLLVILDNGHGVETKGKCSPDKRLMEYKWSREFVYRLTAELIKYNIPVHILVPESADISLAERVSRANTVAQNFKNYGYESVLISIHNNAAGDGSKWCNANGWTCWVYKKASEKSRKLAGYMGQEAERLNLEGNRYIPERRYFEANYYILKNTSMPAVLTENMFQDNREDVDFLLSAEGVEKLVELHLEAILSYMND